MRKTIALRVKLRRGQNDTIGWRVGQRHRSQRKKEHLRRKALELDHKINGLDTKHVLHNYEEILFFLNCREFPYIHLHNPETLTEFLAECEQLEEEGGVVVADRDIRLIQVQEYIQKAAATPRRLEDLCVTRVSQLVGCRQDRAQVVKSLEIAENLRDRVLLKDVCQDLYDERSSDWEPKTDPPGLFYCYKSVQDCRALISSGQ
ncbi:hypothetical protein ACOMHN_001418 [Nucella lapillus]